MGDSGKIFSMVSKSPQNSFQIRTIEKERVCHVHKGELVISYLLHTCGDRLVIYLVAQLLHHHHYS
ncbi:hypothetical protein CsSME_00047111 [Camellia sinensis var. sinensis]